MTRLQKKKMIVLNSGGLDSLIVMALAHDKGYKLVSLFIDYGHISNSNEEIAARAMAEHYKAEHYREEVRLKIWQDGPFFKNPSLRDITKTLVPQRNFVFFSIAAAYMDAMRIPNLGIGWDGWEKNGQLISTCFDKHRSFVNLLRKAFDQSSAIGWLNNYDIDVYAPFLNLNKEQIGKLGLEVDAPFELSWSCYAGKRRNPCGDCIKCKERKALVPLGISDKFNPPELKRK
jgi:7-cyano-7-deazaguanine synthase